MNCRESKEKINEYMDRTLGAADAAAFEEHIQECGPCGRRLEFERGFRRSIISGLPRESAPLGLQSRILAALKEVSETPGAAPAAGGGAASQPAATRPGPGAGAVSIGDLRARRQARNGWFLAAAASVALAILLPFTMKLSFNSGNPPAELAAKARDHAGGSANFEAAMLGEVAKWPVESEYVSLAEECVMCRKVIFDMVSACSSWHGKDGETIEAHLQHCPGCLKAVNGYLKKESKEI